jgi:putative Mg2+ transporter-C (MgtC) family protein
MNILWKELTGGLTNYDDLLRVLIRVFAAILLGGLIALQRVRATKPSGLRTHILVCLGTTVVLLSSSVAGISLEGASRIIQGIVIGIGFVGAGSILKSSEEHLIHGLTASVRLWSTAAVGIAIGLGQIGIALIVAILIIVVLRAISAVEERTGKRPPLSRLSANQPWP